MMYTIVQHSGFGYGNKPGWSKGLETREVKKKSEINLVERVGGLLFDGYGDADDFCDEAMYPEGSGVYPDARGTFSDKTIDELAIYIPVREVKG